MARSKALVVVLAGLMVGAVGCGKPDTETGKAASDRDTTSLPIQTAESGDSPAATLPQTDTPEAAVGRFLEAIRTGNDREAEAMFTELARERIKELDIQVAPRGSDTARFAVGKAEYLAPDGARVPCQWTDIDREGTSRTDDMTWMLRKGPEGWRVAGMAAVIFEGEDPLLLDFENPKETLHKLEMLRAEIARRTAPQESQARQAENPKDQVRR